MAHPEQSRYVDSIADRYPDSFVGTRVLEVGSRNVNGSVRDYFLDCDYVGIDCVPGKDVDVVCFAHQYRTSRMFDVVISCEAFEHDPYLAETIDNVVGILLKKGGLFVGTWASPLRQEHGTIRTTGKDDLYGPNPNYYKGVSALDFKLLAGHLLDPLEVDEYRHNLDVYAFGLRK